MRLLVKSLAFVILFSSFFVIYDRYDMREPVAFEVLHQIDPLPKTEKLIGEGRLLEAQEYLAFFMTYPYMKENLQAKNLLLDIKLKRASPVYKKDKVIEGIITGKSDELVGQVSAGISDFLLFGDLRDLAIEGYHHLSKQEVDKVLVVLSSIGVVASASTLMTAGASGAAKGSISFLKFAKKSGKFPTWLGKYLIKSTKEQNMEKNLKGLKPLFDSLTIMIKSAGVNAGLKLLKNTKGIKSLQASSSFAKIYGKNSSSLLTIHGKETLRLQKGLSKESFTYASTFGKVGVKRMRELGGKGFLKSLVKPIKISRMAKIFDKNSLNILKSIPDKVFYLLGFIALMVLV